MKKRIFSMLLCLVMIISTLTVPAFAAGTAEVTVTPNVTEAAPGSTVEYTVSIGSVSKWAACDFTVVIPDGLTYVANSAKIPNGLKELLDVDKCEWTESTMKLVISGNNKADGYTSTNDLTLLTFSCTVDAETTGNVTVTLKDAAFSDVDYAEYTLSVSGATVNVQKVIDYAVEMTVNGVPTKYETINEAIAAAPVEAYDKTGATTLAATTVKLLKNTNGGFDIGVEAGSLANCKTQNIILDLNGFTLTLDQPVGSGASKDNGLRVLANSKLEIKNGTLACADTGIDNVINNYGELTMTDVVVQAGAAVETTIKNRGNLTLAGETSVANGTSYAITNQPYDYSYDNNENAVLNIADADVTVGKVLVNLGDVKQSQNNAVNAGVPEINISAGNVESIADDGKTAKTPIGNITGGNFDAIVPENLCAAGFEPVTTKGSNGKYTVAPIDYAVEMTVGGVVTKYETINEAIAAAPVDSYANGKAGADAQKAVIKLLKDAEGGFDVGVETGSLSTWKIQNIEIDLNGHTLTLGKPLVGSNGTVTNGIRVLAYSDLVIKNGTVSGLDSDALRGLQNYGNVVVEDVVFEDMGETYDTIGNFGSLELKGETVVPNGSNSAVLNQTYQYSDDSQVPVALVIEDNDVSVGKIVMNMSEYTHSQTGTVNKSNPELTISAGCIKEITSTGNDKTLVGGVTGGSFDVIVPENLCAEGFEPITTKDNNDKYTVAPIDYAVEMTVNGVTTKYETINEAIAAAPVDSYANGKSGTAAEKAVIKLLKDTEGGFDVGVETGSLSTWKIQNIEIDLNNKTLTLGEPLVGSSGTVTNGIRVLAYSKLVIKNGKVSGLDSGALRGLQNYGDAVVEDVVFADMGETYDTIGNFGSLELKGETVVPNGTNSAILNSTYLYSDDSQVPVVLAIEDKDVSVGKIVVDMKEYTHSQTGTVNKGNPELTISAGNIEEITSTGSDKTLVGGVTGGNFDVIVPKNLCADKFEPTTTKDSNGKYSVAPVGFVVEMTVNGVTTQYETINEAIAAAPVDSYANGKAGTDAEKAVIKLLKDVEGGFDVGVETGNLSTWKIQNIEINLNGHTLTLGKPLVGSSGTVTNGIRVLAYSDLVIKNGTVSGLNSDALRGLQNYGNVVVEDVVFENMGETYDTIGNFGSLELKGETVVPNGTNSAILNQTYLYSDDSQVPVALTIKDKNVTVGKIIMNLNEYTHSQTGTVNKSNPKLTITAGNIEEITSTGDDKDLVGGVSGGSFDKVVPADMCAKGFVPKTTTDKNGKYTVKKKTSSSGGGGGGGGFFYDDDTCNGTLADNCPSCQFTDVNTTLWYHEAVDYAINKGLMNGTGDNKFAPLGYMTRSMMWTIMARFDGQNTNGGQNWYEKAQMWAMHKEITDGTNPSANITREQIVTMLWRYVGSPVTFNQLDGFTDAHEVSDWAEDAMRWAVANGVIKGNGNSQLNPTGLATRAEVAQIFLNYFGNK